MLLVTRREFERAHKEHSDCHARVDNAQVHSRLLLLAYAVECGLKALIMRRTRAEDTDDLAEDHQIQHDLREALKILRVPATVVLPDHRTQQKTPQSVPPKSLHTAFRYGVRLVEQEKARTQLAAILAWVQDELRR
jgi:hypothetical protein